MSARRFVFPLFAGVLFAQVACTDVESLNPASTSTSSESTSTDTESTSETTGSTTETPTEVTPKRTVLLRNPIGLPVDNQLVDGDFELSTAYGGGGQYGMRAYTSSGTTQVPLVVETGGLCYSGLTCLKVQKGQVYLGNGAASPGGVGNILSMRARLPEGVPCNKISPIAIECYTFSPIAKADPDEDFSTEWCHYEKVLKASSVPICLYLQNSLQPDQTALVDAAVLKAVDGTMPMKATVASTFDAETLTTLNNLRDFVRRTTPFLYNPISPRRRGDR